MSRRRDETRWQAIAQLHAEGLTTTEIAQRLNVRLAYVWQALKGMEKDRHRAVPCWICGGSIVSTGTRPRDVKKALCLPCLVKYRHASFGQRLTSLRLAAGLTIAELARRTGLSWTSIRAYEEDRFNPMSSTVAKLVAVLGDGLIASMNEFEGEA